MKPASVSDYRELARRRLPKMFFEYIDGGSYAEVTLGRNVADLEAIALRQRVMRDMSQLDMSVEVFGQTMSFPVGLSPVGMAGMYARRGEVQAARAAASAGVPFCLSTVGVCSVEEVAASGAAPWFQLYMLKDRGYMAELLARAKAAGCKVLVFTVDLPLPGSRYRDIRSGFTGANGLSGALNTAWQGATHPEWLWDVWLHGRPHTLGCVQSAVTEGRRVTDFLSWIARNFDRTVTWSDIDWVRKTWDGPIVIKGVLDPEDAREAVKAGAQGLVVSNHGGRQLDGVRSSISALPAVVDAVGGDLEIFMDGGVRSGLDVLKALALGARACFVGRAWAYALGAGGQPMVEKMLGTLRSELATAMILTGCNAARSADKSLLDVAP
ncbi:MAG: L-lactate dehydrogenase [Phenylobacterium sp.]|uniref:L-lactate dehydrogenase n=1 Tax=Phenylobacterium sp. TaxID=1871053 RepID=UPI002737689B|nr:L-lactate dehydrogenase [Phenylobacterium sp.]MDP3748337.1 L-lactate dehydrogenase [Phenylobacterium sp.]